MLIDEIQRVPTLLDVIHRLIEEQRNVRFVLTGSSARKLRRGASNLLAGRLLHDEMHPFLAAELGRNFELGPAFWSDSTDLAGGGSGSYAPSLRRSLFTRRSTSRSLGSGLEVFAHLLEASSFAHGSLLNLSA